MKKNAKKLRERNQTHGSLAEVLTSFARSRSAITISISSDLNAEGEKREERDECTPEALGQRRKCRK